MREHYRCDITLKSGVVDFLFRAIKTIGYPTIGCVEACAGNFLPFRNIGGIGIFNPAVLSPRYVGTHAVVERLACEHELVVVSHEHVDTLGIGSTDVAIALIVSTHRRRIISAERLEDVVGVVVESIELNRQKTIPERSVETVVERARLGPGEVRIGDIIEIHRVHSGVVEENLVSESIGAEECVGT